MVYRLATIESDGRLTVTVRRHKLAWLPRTKEPLLCVIAVRRGSLRITTLDKWAEQQGWTLLQAKQRIENLSNAVELPGIPNHFIAPSKRTGRPGHPNRGNPVYKIQLPDVAIWGLFKQGEGLMDTPSVRASAQVLVASDKEGMYVFSREALDMLSEGGLLE